MGVGKYRKSCLQASAVVRFMKRCLLYRQLWCEWTHVLCDFANNGNIMNAHAMRTEHCGYIYYHFGLHAFVGEPCPRSILLFTAACARTAAPGEGPRA